MYSFFLALFVLILAVSLTGHGYFIHLTNPERSFITRAERDAFFWGVFLHITAVCIARFG
jgi:hypothetical protein